MTYTIAGRLCARPCDGLEVPLDDATVRFYRAESREGILAAATAKPKETFGIVPPDAVEERADLLLAEGELDGEGRFEVIIEEGAEYDHEEPVVVDVRVGDPCGGEGEVQATITTIAPRWRETEEGLRFGWETCLTTKQYCRILEEHGCWMVCGQITDCDTGDGLPGLDVEVFDSDIVQHESLGSDRTDPNGWYVIYFSRRDFEATPARFAPIELQPGPDLFFEIRQGANVLLDESPSDGRQGGREDVDHCSHIDLCVDFEEPGDDPTAIAAAWTSVGRYVIPDTTGLKDFDPDGYAGTPRFAFTGTLPLEGSVPVANVPIPGARSDPIRYRFKVGRSNLKNGASGTASPFNQIVGAGNNLFDTVQVGLLVYRNRSTGVTDQIPVEVEPGDLRTGGWVRIDDAITSAYGATSRPAPLRDYRWVPSGRLAELDTGPLTSEPDVPSGAADAGDPVPSGDRIADEEIAIRFEVEQRGAGGWQPHRGGGRTLNRIVINNNPEFRKLEVVQLQGNQCKPITIDDVDLAYTAYHPHFRDVELEIRRADQNSWTTLNDGSTEVSFFNNNTTAARFDHHNNPQFDISGEVTEECTYLVRLRSRRRLTTGRSNDHWSGDLQAFYARSP